MGEGFNENESPVRLWGRSGRKAKRLTERESSEALEAVRLKLLSIKEVASKYGLTYKGMWKHLKRKGL
jgi:hypothetical protein